LANGQWFSQKTTETSRGWFDNLSNDFRFACRTLLRVPGFTITVVAALVLCIGANIAIFSVVDTVLFRPLPFKNQEQLVAISEGVPALGFPTLPFSCADYLFVAENNHSFEQIASYKTQLSEISGVGKPRTSTLARITPSLFNVLEVSPSIGR